MSEPTPRPPASPPRPSHQIHRSISEVSPPTLKLHRPNHHQHHSHTHHHAHLHSRRAQSNEKNKEREPQSAHPNLQPFLGGEGREGRERNWRDIGQARSEGVTPAGSRDVSRRPSAGAWDSDAGPGAGTGVVGGIPFPRERERRVKDGEVKEERERGVLRATELRNSLINLNTLSNTTTCRLDNTYYSVLEKLSMLQSSISSLKELASLTRALNTDFQIESADLVRQISGQLEGFQEFKSQETRIQSLQERVQKGRAKIKTLGGRVDVIKGRVEGWERAEVEWQDKTRRRLKALWIVMSVVAAIVVSLVVFRYTPARTHGPGVIKGLNISDLAGRIPNFEEMGNETWTLRRETEGVLEGLKRRQGEVLEEDPRLRVFDEL